MTKGAKIAIGCGIAAIVVVVAAVVGVVALGYWGASKARGVVAQAQRIEEYKQSANRNTFERPANGVLQEDRLLKFIEIRKQVFAVYEQHKDTIAGWRDKKDANLGDVMKGAGFIQGILTAQAKAQADAGMSDDEYRFMVESIYKSSWASSFMKESGGRTVSETVKDETEKARAEMEKAEQENPQMPEEARRALREARENMEAQAGQAASGSALDVPPENVALFQKYESEIKKYAMTGLEAIGL